MPEITNENKELKENKESVAKKNTKSSSKTTKKSDSSSVNKTASQKKSSMKTSSDKTATGKNTTTSSKKNDSTKSKTTSKKSTKTNPKDIKKTTSKSKTVSLKEEGQKTSTRKADTKNAETRQKSTTAKNTEIQKIPTKKSKAKTESTIDITKKAPSKKMEEKVEAKIEKKVDKKKEEKIKEETVIQKIKNFIAKIVAMQEEARKEAEAKKAEKEEVKKESKDTKTEKENTQENTPYMLEYYDLPYRYNETVVKILAQTPKRLFVYWDISDNDRQKYLKAFGERFFEDTYPVLLVHNVEKDYTFEVSINDFANSWYLDINDPKSTYVIELGRKFRTKPEIVNIARTEETKDVVLHNDYVPITASNVLEVPNDHILFENVQLKVLYRNVKDNTETFVDIENNEYTRNMGHIYNIYDIYKEIYKNEIDDESLFDLLNPSSMSSSTFK